MSLKTYKKIDSLDRFLANFWKIFPNLTANNLNNHVIKENLIKDTIEPYLISSIEFCDLLQKNIIQIQNFNRGGFGTVGYMKIVEDNNLEEIMGIIVSRNRIGGFEPFYIPLILKKGNKPVNLNKNNFSVKMLLPRKPQTQSNPIILELPDPISEITFGAMVGSLYDAGLTPGFLKYFGSYGCNTIPPDQPNYIISILSEKCTVPLEKLLHRDGENLIIQPVSFINLLFQYVYTIYIGKKYLGLTHFDTQFNNVMITYIHKEVYNIPELSVTPYIYHGIDMSKVKYILFKCPHLHNTYIVIKNEGLMLKLIDYGLCSAFINHSLDPNISEIIDDKGRNFKNNFIITTTLDQLASSTLGSLRGVGETKPIDAFKKSFYSNSARNTVEIQYLLNNMCEYITKGIDRTFKREGPEDPIKNKDYINVLNNFYKFFFERGENLTELLKDPKNISMTIQRDSLYNDGKESKVWDKYSRNHNVGHDNPKFNDVNELLNGLIRCCVNSPKIINNITYLTTEKDIDISLVHSNLNNNTICLILDSDHKLENNMFKFFDASNKFKISCLIDPNLKNCNELKKYDPNRTLKKPILSNTKELFNEEGKLIGNILDIQNHRIMDKFIRESINNNMNIYSLQINPSGVISSKSSSEDFVYRSYQQWLNYKNIDNKKDGTYIETININIISLNHINLRSSIQGGAKTGLWEFTESDFFKNHPTSLAINGGYYVVKGNIEQQKFIHDNIPQISELDVDSECKPIGFYYNKDDLNNSGTLVPIPKPYTKYFGVIYCENNKINIVPYDEFMQVFRTLNEPILYKLENENYYATEQPIIQTNNGPNSTYGGSPIYINGVALSDIPGFQYAFSSGPLLVVNKNIVFDLETMINKEFTIVDTDISSVSGYEKPPNLTSYKVIFNAMDNYMFKSSEDDKNQYYGMRHSNRYMVHNVMAINESDEIFIIMVEGRGYDAPGLDRVQLANLVSKFNIVTAVSLDGGFSANAIYKINSQPRKYLMNTPDKERCIGIKLGFYWEN